jgi:hypothetical protein
VDLFSAAAMSASSMCPKCGKPLPFDAPGGRCPECVLGMLDEVTHSDSAASETIPGVFPAVDPISERKRVHTLRRL